MYMCFFFLVIFQFLSNIYFVFDICEPVLDVDTVHCHLEHLESCLKNECVLENCNLQFSSHHSYIIKDF